jgi:chemotaxis protein MotB
MKLFLLSLSSVFVLFSCVSKKKFEAELASKQKAQQQASKEAQERRQTEAQLKAAQSDIERLKGELAGLQDRYKTLEKNYENDKKAFEASSNISQQALSNSAKQNEELRQRLSAKETELNEKQAKLDRLQADLQAREKRVKELEQAIADRDAKAKALRQRLADALLGFQASDLTVEERNGKVYVSLSQNLLFASGSSTLDRKGVDALRKLADVLNKNEDINILVEGHTDSEGDEKMNWELSTRRSLSISQALIDGKVNPERITAAGRGEHAPVASNATKEGRAKNRRTEIILTPRLDLIYDMIKN